MSAANIPALLMYILFAQTTPIKNLTPSLALKDIFSFYQITINV